MNGSGRPVLIAYDGSDAARYALSQAAPILTSSPVLVVTVWEAGLAYVTTAPPADGLMMAPMIDADIAQDMDREVHAEAERVARDGAEFASSLGLDAAPLAVADEGDVPRTLLSLAKNRNAAAIVVGSRGLGGIRARLEGSTSKALLKHASCPVVVVHETHDH
jgi:nucleotide-binding universal stress UspA family protein